MSKKVKDLTLEEIKELCTEHYPACKKNGKKCPMFKTTINCDQIMSIIRSALRHNHDALEEEIEIEPKKKKQPTKRNNLGNELWEKDVEHMRKLHKERSNSWNG